MKLKNISIILILVILLQIFIPAIEALATDEIITFEDRDLKKLIVKDYDTNGDGEISKTEIEAIEKLEISSSLYTVKNLSGLEYAINLKRINLELHPSVDTSAIVNEVKKLPANTKIELSGFVGMDLGIMKKGEERVVNYSDDPLLKEAFFDETSKLYTSGATLSDSYNSSIIVNNEDKTITVKGNEFGKNLYKYVRVMPSKRTYSGLYSLYLYMNWTVLENFNSTEEINIPDQNLKEQLLEKYDFDKDEKITDCDLKSMHGNLIFNGDVSFHDVVNLTGLEYATNLEKLDIFHSEAIKDLTPISGLTSLKSLYLIDIDKGADVSKLSTLVNIENLLIESNDYKNFDLSFTKDMVDLRTIRILNASSIDNVEILNNKNINLAHLRYKDASCIKDLDKITSVKVAKICVVSESEEGNNLIVNALKNTSFDKVYINVEKYTEYGGMDGNGFNSFKYDLGKKLKNDTITIKYEDINSIIENLINPDYLYYNSEYYIYDTQMLSAVYEDVLTFDNEQKTITINTSEMVGQRNYIIKFTSNKADIFFNLCFEIANEITIQKGDLNGDGQTTLYDAFSGLRMVILGSSLSKEQIEIMDFNNDGQVTLYDAFTCLREVILG